MTPGRLSRRISVGIHVPTVSTTGLEGAETYAAFFRTCEALGFDALWTEDRILHPAPIADTATGSTSTAMRSLALPTKWPSGGANR